MSSKNRVIAYYLPQYHPIPENNRWWGKGFTEWTNVGKAKPIFRGHYQPKVPADLGYYDLRVPEVREEQAKLAKEYGVEGFCYWHYWFGNGKQLLERPFNEVLASGKPDFPFCLAWANHSWEDKTFKTGGSKKILMEQTYPDEADHINHFSHLLPAFKDHRYIKVDNKPLFVIYNAVGFPNVTSFMHLWNKLAKENGLNGIHFVAYTEEDNQVQRLKSLGFDGINSLCLWQCLKRRSIFDIRAAYAKVMRILFKRSLIFSYKTIYKSFISKNHELDYCYPSIIPNWDPSARRSRVSLIVKKSTPKLFFQHVKAVINAMKHKPEQHRLAFIKSWNEWGEGNYMEPDLKFGKGYLEALHKALKCE